MHTANISSNNVASGGDKVILLANDLIHETHSLPDGRVTGAIISAEDLPR